MRRAAGPGLDALLAGSDVFSIHLVLGDRTRGLVGARELALMKPTAYLVNIATFFREAAEDIGTYLDGAPIRVLT
ncbi:NAD(P)-dependent oxidoreductase [Microbispora bryophytorum]|uniref:NAD(P)-dependent oxidoreductase n=1 Tax=Microbispora bryophytorum TaxID=1460882 RepID=UPI0033E075E1